MAEACIGRENGLSLKVHEAEPKDVGHSIARMDLEDMVALAPI